MKKTFTILAILGAMILTGCELNNDSSTTHEIEEVEEVNNKAGLNHVDTSDEEVPIINHKAR